VITPWVTLIGCCNEEDTYRYLNKFTEEASAPYTLAESRPLKYEVRDTIITFVVSRRDTSLIDRSSNLPNVLGGCPNASIFVEEIEAIVLSENDECSARLVFTRFQDAGFYLDLSFSECFNYYQESFGSIGLPADRTIDGIQYEDVIEMQTVPFQSDMENSKPKLFYSLQYGIIEITDARGNSLITRPNG